MAKIRTKNFESTDLEFVPFERSPDIEDAIKQTLARMMGWDYVNQLWRRLRVDDTGSIGVTSSPSSSALLECASVAVAGAADLLVVANASRRSIRVENIGPDAVVIDDTAGVALASGYTLLAGDTWYSETYRGDIYALAITSNAVVKVMEER